MTDCGVCIGGGWDGSVENYYSHMTTAKRNFACYECKTIIVAGELHEQAGGEYEDGRESWRFCAFCSEVGKVFSCGDSRLFGTLWDDMEESVFPELTMGNKCFQKLTPLVKTKLLERWNKWKFEK